MTEHLSYCLNCGKASIDFPLSRPRTDGSRHPFAYCPECLDLARQGFPMRDGGAEAQKRADRDSKNRARGRNFTLFPV